jgi:Kef-type K+ transport system membrane component KefB
MDPTGTADSATRQLIYGGLILVLFVLPVVLRRFGVPGAITSLGLGILAGFTDLFDAGSTIAILSTFGIVALFLSAGLEIDLLELRAKGRPLLEYIVAAAVAVALLALLGAELTGLPRREALLVALILLIPSTGFILDSLRGLGLSDAEAERTKTFAIAVELLGLAGLLVASQSSVARLAVSVLAILALVGMVPVIMKGFASHVVHYAPKTEFAFLLVLGLFCAYITKLLGVYYLVGAFLVGVAARRFRQELPALSSDRILHTTEDFGHLFAPFYFFYAGMAIHPQLAEARWILFGATLALVLLPLRVKGVELLLRRRMAPGEGDPRRIALAVLPTLVFSLVLIDFLRGETDASFGLLDALTVYTIVATMAPAFFFRRMRPAEERGPVTEEEADPLPHLTP